MSEAVIRVDSFEVGKQWRVEIDSRDGRVYAKCAALVDGDLASVPDLPKSLHAWRPFVQSLVPGGDFLPTAQNLKDVGRLIRERLFGSAELSARLDQLQRLDEGSQQSLRLALEVDEADALLATIPIELAWQPNAFVFKSDSRAVFRVLPSCAKKNLRLGKSARVLIATAQHDPIEEKEVPPTATELAAHAGLIQAKLAAAGFAVEVLPDASPDGLFERLAAKPGFDLLYLVAHGFEDSQVGGRLALRETSLSGDELSRKLVALGRATKPLQAVVLCSCGSALAASGTLGLAQRLVLPASGGDSRSAALAAIGFRAPIEVDFALAFFVDLFAALGGGESLENAFAKARFEVDDEQPQWALPLLYSRHRDLDELSLGAEAVTILRIENSAPEFELPRLPSALGDADVSVRERSTEFRYSSKEPRYDVLVREEKPHKPAIRSRLPRQPRPYFVGRMPELKKLRKWVKRPQGGVAQITAVRGVGGIGKSELALVLAHERHVAHEAVIWLERPDLNVRGALFDLLSLADGPRPADDTPTEALAAELRRRFAVEGGLLVLDDLESAETAELLNPGGRWNVLATTRKEKLIAGAKEIALDLLSKDEAIHLLSQVAWGQPAPPAEEREDAAALVERLGLLPLAIELAGNTIRREVISVAEYAESLDVGVGPAQSDLERVDSIALRSLRSMDEEDERVFLTLALLPRSGVPLETLANALDSGVVPTTRRVDRLIKHGLVRWSPEAGRYGMHAHLRAATVRRVGARPELREELLGGVGRALQKLMAWVREPIGKQTFVARERWLTVRDVFDAIETSGFAGGTASGSSIADVLADAYVFRSDRSVKELEDYLGEAARLSGGGEIFTRANVLKARGDLRRFRDDLEGASGDYDLALGLFEAMESPLGQANVLKARGDLRRRRSDLEGSLGDYDVALGLFEAVEDRLGQANVLRARGDLRCFRSDLEGASRDYDVALGLFEAVEDRLGRANVLQARGDLAYAQKNLEAALAWYREALATYEELEDRHSQANVLAEMSRVFNLRGETEAAENAARSALDLARQSENRYAENLAKQTLQALADRAEPPAPEPPTEAPPNTDEA